MKKLSLLMCLIGLLIHTSCTTSKTVFNDKTATHSRIAILPFEAHFKLKPEQKEFFPDEEIRAVELDQGKKVQNAIESYLSRKRKLRVTVQSAGVTNSKLKEAGIDIYNINENDFSKIAKILDVDAVVNGYLETEKPMDEELATKLNIAKQLETVFVGTSFGSNINTSTNRGWCSVSIFEGERGDRLWSFEDKIQLGVGSNTKDVVDRMMRKGARKFPY